MKSAPAAAVPARPPYRVPSLGEIRAVPPCGLTVASTFSGCGGSCTGYLMAGFRVLWANEFVPAAQASYRANWPDCFLDPRDVRQVKAEEILAQTGLEAGELDLLDGSPPCQAFSTAGKRHKGWGKEKRYEHGARQKNETLFGEFVRLLRGLMPRVFVAENVSGLVKGVAKGFFLEILKALEASGYRVEARLLDAQWLGVPQMRQRIIFVGVRNDLGRRPAFPRPLPYRYSVRDALATPVADVVRDRRGAFGKEGKITDVPAPSVMAGTAGNFWVTHDESGDWNAGDVSERPCPTGRSGRAGTMFVEGAAEVDISRFAIGREWDRTPIGGSNDRYLNLKRSALDGPCHSVSADGGNLSAASVTHPTQKRKFTIAELKRVCGFPDDYVLTGSYAQQWARLGNSVPPVMMYHVAKAIRDRVLGA